MTAILLPHGVYRGIDTVHALTPERCAALASAGVAWVARYIPADARRLEVPDAGGGDHLGCWTLSTAERGWIRDAGLLLLPVQWGPGSGDTLDAARGYLRGVHAALAARHLGIEGCHLWCDLEGASAMRAGSSGCREYVEAWAAAVTAAGYRAGLYVALPLPLSGPAMYGLRGVTSYWGAAQASLPQPLPRGYAVQQGPLGEVEGIPCDPDILRPDCLGDLPLLAA